MAAGRPFALAFEGARAQCGLVPTGDGLAAEVAQVLGAGSLTVEKAWRIPEAQLLPLFQALLILTEGPCLLLHPANDAAAPDMRRLADMLRSRPSAANGSPEATSSHVPLANNTELILLPIPAAAGGDEAPFTSILLGFHVPAEAAWAAQHHVQTARLPVVLDIDETLVVAHTANGLNKRLADAGRRRRHIQHEQAQLDDHRAQTQRGQELRAAREAVLREEQLLQQDLNWLRQFMQDDCITSDNTTIAAQLEPVPGGQPRPVIRHPRQPLVLTRIDARDANTSMAIRLRPGWEELRQELMGIDPRRPELAPRQRFDVFVCTTAQRPYALEVWRLFDPDGRIIAPAQLQARLVNVEHESAAAQPPKRLSLACGVGPPMRGRSALPMAVIADDRTDVWAVCSRPQVVPLEAYSPYRRAAQAEAEERQGTAPSLNPWLSLVPLKDMLQKLRAAYSLDVNLLLKQRMRSQHEPAARRLSWPRVRTIADLLQDASLVVPAQPTPLSVLPQKGHIVVEVPVWEQQNPLQFSAAPLPPLAPAVPPPVPPQPVLPRAVPAALPAERPAHTAASRLAPDAAPAERPAPLALPALQPATSHQQPNYIPLLSPEEAEALPPGLGDLPPGLGQDVDAGSMAGWPPPLQNGAAMPAPAQPPAAASAPSPAGPRRRRWGPDLGTQEPHANGAGPGAAAQAEEADGPIERFKRVKVSHLQPAGPHSQPLPGALPLPHAAAIPPPRPPPGGPLVPPPRPPPGAPPQVAPPRPPTAPYPGAATSGAGEGEEHPFRRGLRSGGFEPEPDGPMRRTSPRRGRGDGHAPGWRGGGGRAAGGGGTSGRRGDRWGPAADVRDGEPAGAGGRAHGFGPGPFRGGRGRGRGGGHRGRGRDAFPGGSVGRQRLNDL